MVQKTHLVQLVEISQDDHVIRQLWKDLLPHAPPPLRLPIPVQAVALRVRCALAMIATEESVPAVDDILAVYPIELSATAIFIAQLVFEIDIAPPWPESGRWDRSLIREQVVAPFGAESASKAHKGHVDWRGPCGKDFIPRTASVAVEVDQDMNTVLDDSIDEFLGGPTARVVKDWCFALNLLPVDRVVACGCGVAVRFDALRVMHAEDRLH